MKEKLHDFCHNLWIRIVYMLIACLEADLRGRALEWLYPFLETETVDRGRYARSGGRYHREPR